MRNLSISLYGSLQDVGILFKQEWPTKLHRYVAHISVEHEQELEPFLETLSREVFLRLTLFFEGLAGLVK